MPRHTATFAACLLAGLVGVAGAPAVASGGTARPHGAAADGATDEPPLVATEPPEIRGTPREKDVLRAFPGRWTPQRDTTTYRWLRDGERIRGARDRRYRLGWADVGSRISVEVRVLASGHAATTATSRPTRHVAYATPVRRRVTYSVTTRGSLHASVPEFRQLAQETYGDPRGWRSHGIQFRQVRRGGDFTLVIAAASTMTSFSSGCSAYWSCRVGRFVVINQDRWLHASPAWLARKRSIRDYRHLVVNHETGHWLGRGHAGCRGRGPAPVMMQQSKGTGACSFNPWPLPGE